MANDKDFKVKNGLDVGSTVTLQAYGSGSNSGTAAYTLAVDSSGNVIETTGGGGGISNVVEDITPQLGGNLDVNGNSIVSVSGGDIAITPDANGQIVLDGLNWPISDGTDRQVLVTDGSGELSFDDIPPVQVDATNNTASAIAAGTPVYQTGVSGQNITIAPADASSASTMPAIGVTKGAISASGGTGVVVVSGFLKGINTSAYTAGDTLYVANGGGFATSPPAGETVLIENLGKVVKSDASAGSIIVTGAGRANATPNLNDGNFFLGNSSNQAGIASFSSSVRGEVSATDAGGDGSFSYNSGTGVFTYTGPSAAETRAHFTGGTGVTITNGEVAIGQAVGTSNDVTFNDVIVSGDLTVSGSSTTVDTTNLTVTDSLIELSSGLTAGATNDAGLIIERGTSGNNAFIGWDESADKFTLGTTTATGSSTGNLTVTTGTLVADIEGDVTGNVTGTVSSLSNHDTGVLAEGSNLYYTNARADARISAASIDDLSDVNTSTVAPTDGQVLTWDNANGYWEPADSAGGGGGGVPSGTKQLFVQTAAPTGWTKDTTHNNKALRVVSGTAGSGGSDAFTTTFGSGKTTAAHTLTTSEMPAHTHSIGTKFSYGGGTSGKVAHGSSGSSNQETVYTGSNGSSGSHSHSLSGFDLQYVDVIIATKD